MGSFGSTGISTGGTACLNALMTSENCNLIVLNGAHLFLTCRRGLQVGLLGLQIARARRGSTSAAGIFWIFKTWIKPLFSSIKVLTNTWFLFVVAELRMLNGVELGHFLKRDLFLEKKIKCRRDLYLKEIKNLTASISVMCLSMRSYIFSAIFTFFSAIFSPSLYMSWKKFN